MMEVSEVIRLKRENHETEAGMVLGFRVLGILGFRGVRV